MQARDSGKLIIYKWQPLPDEGAKYQHKKDEAINKKTNNNQNNITNDKHI